MNMRGLRPFCLCLLRAGTKHIGHHTQHSFSSWETLCQVALMEWLHGPDPLLLQTQSMWGPLLLRSHSAKCKGRKSLARKLLYSMGQLITKPSTFFYCSFLFQLPVFMYLHATVCRWRSENGLQKLVLSFQHVRPNGRDLYPLNHPARPIAF